MKYPYKDYCSKCDGEINVSDYIGQEEGTCFNCRQIIKSMKDITGLEKEQADMQIMSDEEIFRKYGLEF